MRIFRLGKKGSGSVFGPLEEEVMEVVWALSPPVTVAQVLRALRSTKKQKKDLAYSTVKAILSNLTDKSYLRKTSEGRSNVFSPIENRQKFQERVVSEVVGTLARNYRQPLLAHLVDEIATDRTTLDDLERLIAEKRAAMKRR